MPLVLGSWDLPTNPEQLEAYNGRAREWTGRVLAFPGIVEWRAYRNPQLTTPQVLVFQEYESLEAARRWVQSSELAQIMAEMRSFGCTNVTVHVWDKSPLAPEPLRP